MSDRALPGASLGDCASNRDLAGGYPQLHNWDSTAAGRHSKLERMTTSTPGRTTNRAPNRVPPDRAALDAYATRQSGVFSRAQAAECGYSARAIRAQLHNGAWVPVLRHVFAPRAVAVTPHVRDVAAQLVVPGSILAGPSAARWHGVTVPSAATFVLADPTYRGRPVGVHIMRDMIAADDLCVLDGRLVTTLDRTVFDCARILPDQSAIQLLEFALQHCWTTLPRLSERVQACTGRHGTPRLVQLLRTAAIGSHTASARLAIRLLQRAGIWGWLAKEPISDRWGLICVGDIVFSKPSLVLLLDPGPPPDQDQDRWLRQREERLAAAGWATLKLTWGDLAGRPDDVVATIRATLDRLGR
jgi:hypothetical protein